MTYGGRQQSKTWAAVRSELSTVIVERDRAIAKLIEIRGVLGQQHLYSKEDLVEELEQIVD